MRARRMQVWVVLRSWVHMRPIGPEKVLFRFQTGTLIHLRNRKGYEFR